MKDIKMSYNIFESLNDFLNIRLVESDMFLNYSTIYPGDFDKFKNNYKDLNPKNIIIADNDVIYGIRKGETEPHWKYIKRLDKIYHDQNDKFVLGLINKPSLTKKNNPWS